MNKKLVILLIEDNMKDVEMIIARFNETLKWLKDKNLISEMGFEDLSIEHIKGDKLGRHKGNRHYYYDDSVIDAIESKINEFSEEDKIGILSDILLTKEDDEKARVNNFNEISLVSKLYEHFEERCAIYFITSISSFGSRVWRIFGRECLAGRYIQKGLVDLPSKKGIAEVLFFLSNKHEMPVKIANKIEENEIKDFM